MKKNIAPIIITAILVGSAAFYGGMSYGKAGLNQGGGQFARGGGQGQFGRGGGRGQGGGFVSGDIISSDDKSITVKLPSDGSKIIFFSPTTHISKSVDGEASDLAVGKTVMVNGATNSDGSVTAQNIQIRTTPPASATGPAATTAPAETATPAPVSPDKTQK